MAGFPGYQVCLGQRFGNVASTFCQVIIIRGNEPTREVESKTKCILHRNKKTSNKQTTKVRWYTYTYHKHSLEKPLDSIAGIAKLHPTATSNPDCLGSLAGWILITSTISLQPHKHEHVSFTPFIFFSDVLDQSELHIAVSALGSFLEPQNSPVCGQKDASESLTAVLQGKGLV